MNPAMEFSIHRSLPLHFCILGLPKEAVVTMVISAGKRAEGGVYGPRLRFDREHFVHTH